MQNDIHSIQRLSNKYGGASQKAIQTLERAVAINTITYGAQAYDLNRTHLRTLQSLHRATLRTITRLPNHTRLDKLQAAVRMPPWTL